MRRYFTVLLAALWAGQAQAHPHVWVYTDAKVLAENGLVNAVQVHWQFDEMYSATFMEEADTNGNGKLERGETLFTIDQVFVKNPQNLLPFILLQFNGTKPEFSFKNVSIWLDDKEMLNYRFDLVLEQPQALSGQHKIAFYDPEFYVSFEQELELALPQNSGCTQNLAEDTSISIYMDLVHPEVYSLNCTGEKA